MQGVTQALNVPRRPMVMHSRARSPDRRVEKKHVFGTIGSLKGTNVIGRLLPWGPAKNRIASFPRDVPGIVQDPEGTTLHSTLPGSSDEQDFVPLYFSPHRKPWGRWVLRALLLIGALASAAVAAAVLIWAIAADSPVPTLLVLTMAVGPFLLVVAGGVQFRSTRIALLASLLAFVLALASSAQWWAVERALATRSEQLRIIALLAGPSFLLMLLALLLYRARPRRIRYPRM